MASGLAYRLDRPGKNLLHLHSSMSRARLHEFIRRYRTQCQQQRPRCQPACWRRPPSRPLWLLLPPEIVHMIFLHLDMITLGTLRLVNTLIYRQVDSLYEYWILRAHAAETLKILDLSQCTHYFPLHRLYREFCHPRCRSCPDFGPYLYLPTLSRVCLQCVLRRNRYRVAVLNDVSACDPRFREDWWDLPVVYSLDFSNGRCSPDRLINVAQAKLMYQQQQRRRQQSGRSSKGPAPQELTYQLRDTYHALLRLTVAFPCWDPHARRAEPGVYCYGCTKYWEISRGKSRRNPRRPQDYAWNTSSPGSKWVDRAFRVQDLPRHFSTCPHVVSRLRKGEDHNALRFGEPVGRIIRVDADGERGAGRSARVGKK